MMSKEEYVNNINNEGNPDLKYFYLKNYLKKYKVILELIADRTFLIFYLKNDIFWLHPMNYNHIVDKKNLLSYSHDIQQTDLNYYGDSVFKVFSDDIPIINNIVEIINNN
jgi:hypothetical protein